MRNKLVATLDIVLSARLVDAEIKQTVEKAHKVCDPHLAISFVNARQTISNPVEMAVELEMLDAAVTLSQEGLKEIEDLKRSIAKTLQGCEVMEALGAEPPPKMLEDLQQMQQDYEFAGLRLEEMEQLRDLTATRAVQLTSQL